MIKKIILICLTSIFFIYSPSSFSIENKILVKIDNQIITSFDVNNEYKYLIALNPSLKNSKKEDIIKLSKRSIINERIKKIEIEKSFNNPQIPEKFLDIILQNVYSKIGIENISAFWLQLKLLFVFILTGYHFFLFSLLRSFSDNKNSFSAKFYRIINEIPTILLIGIVFTVVFKPL